jgi:hypothetical protein
MRLRAIAACALLLAAASACRSVRPAAGSIWPACEPRQPVQLRFRRVAIVPFANRTRYAQPAEQFTTYLREKLDEWTTGTDVIVIPADSLPGLNDPLLDGKLPLEVLVEVRKRHLADAVVIGSVDDFNPYWKPSVHVTLKVVDTATACFPFELSQTWDANEQPVRDEIDAYYRRNVGQDDCRFGPNLFVTSPSYFLRFVADRVAEGFTASLGRS